MAVPPTPPHLTSWLTIQERLPSPNKLTHYIQDCDNVGNYEISWALLLGEAT